MLVEGAIVFDSWAAVISESVVMTMQNVARDIFGPSLVCNYRKSILDMYDPARRQNPTFWLLERQDMITTAGEPGLSQCGFLMRNGTKGAMTRL